MSAGIRSGFEACRAGAIPKISPASSEAEKAFWRRVIERPDEQTAEDWPQALAYMERHGAIQETLARARAYGQKSRQALQLFSPGPMRDALSEAVDFAVERAL